MWVKLKVILAYVDVVLAANFIRDVGPTFQRWRSSKLNTLFLAGRDVDPADSCTYDIVTTHLKTKADTASEPAVRVSPTGIFVTYVMINSDGVWESYQDAFMYLQKCYNRLRGPHGDRAKHDLAFFHWGPDSVPFEQEDWDALAQKTLAPIAQRAVQSPQVHVSSAVPDALAHGDAVHAASAVSSTISPAVDHPAAVATNLVQIEDLKDQVAVLQDQIADYQD